MNGTVARTAYPIADPGGMRPTLGVHLRNWSSDDRGGWEALVDVAVAADKVGIDKVIVSDHVVLGERLDAYGRPEIGGLAGGRQPTDPDGHWLDPLTLLAFIAARTTRVRLASHVLLAALRRPVVLAKSLATLDVLSNGRLDVGVGIGWQREEYEAAGLNFHARGRLLDETLAICRELWSQDRASIRVGDRLVEGLHQRPKPRQEGGVPIWVSGTLTPPVVKRIVQYGTGWIPWGPDALDLGQSISRMRRAVADSGRDPLSVRVVHNIRVMRNASGEARPDESLRLVPELLSAGATDFITQITPVECTPDHLREWAQLFRDIVNGPSK